ncbi:MAG: 30S ribosomal protein S11 [Christensenellaceae bacterium]|nr:30S ribosomal protein S11 [Christensenellaceae bacterium]
MRNKTVKTKKKRKVSSAKGKAFITSSFNNTIVTITDDKGQVINWASAGIAGFKGSRKSTPFAAQMTSEKAGSAAKDMGLLKVDVFIKGPGAGRDSAIRALSTSGLEVLSITDVSPIAHNGCRPPKRRRK